MPQLDPPPGRLEAAAFVLAGGGILFILAEKLAVALLAGLLVFGLLRRTANLVWGPRLSRGAAKIVSAAVLGVAAAGVTAAAALGLGGFLRGRVGDVPELLRQMSAVVEELRRRLVAYGAGWLLPSGADPESFRLSLGSWLGRHAEEIRHAGSGAGRFLVHIAVGIAIGLLVFFRRERPAPGPLGRALAERVGRLHGAFEKVVIAQVRISAINTALTAIYILGLVRLLGFRLPLPGTLLALTFVAGLVPIVGNVISNTPIVLLSAGVSPWLAVLSLTFLVVIHKLEYLLNARIVGAQVKAAAWEILLAMVLFDAAFGIPGLVLAPVLYAWIKDELMVRGLV